MTHTKAWYIAVFGKNEGIERYNVQQQNKYIPGLRRYRGYKLKKIFKKKRK